ncbi:sel1 repeat family protein [Photobacterium kishitanii]|nr:sel1 repeat family protein [Photobacterium kishitanii]
MINNLCNGYLSALFAEKRKANNDKIPSLVEKLKIASEKNEDALIALSCLRLMGELVEKDVTGAKASLARLVKSSPNVAFTVGVLAACKESGYGEDVFLSESNLRRVVSGNLSKKISADKCAVAARMLGDYYSNGKHFKVDVTEAARFYELAAMSGCVDSLCSLGKQLLYGGIGAFGDAFKIDEAKGLKFLSIADSKGNSDAAIILAKYHMKKSLDILSRVPRIDKDDAELLKALKRVEWRL